MIREIWSSPMVFRRASRRHVLCEDARAFNAEARRRVRVFRETPWNVGDGDRILILGEDEDGKTDDLKGILVPVDHQFSQVRGQRDDSMTALLLAPLPTDDDDDEEVLSKNNSSTILRFSLAGDGIGDKCRFLTGGDAEVTIWEKLWNRNRRRRDWLSYDILQSPHHCSWHSLSYDSWSEMREEAEVSEDARNALSQARSGATIVASSNPIKDDDNDPPCIRAKREYEAIAEDAAGSFECVGERPSEKSPDVYGIRDRRPWVAPGDRTDGSPNGAWAGDDRPATSFAWVARTMAGAEAGDAVRRALALIPEHPGVDAVGVAQIDEASGVVTVDVTFAVNLPSEWRREGQSPSRRQALGGSAFRLSRRIPHGSTGIVIARGLQPERPAHAAVAGGATARSLHLRWGSGRVAP